MMEQNVFEPFAFLFSDAQTVIEKDFKLNFQRLLESPLLPVEHRLAVVAAVARSINFTVMEQVSFQQLEQHGVGADVQQEIRQSVGLMGMLNQYYRFKSAVNKDEDYAVAQLRMNAFVKPQMGKVLFEILALAVSVVNGCYKCIAAHEQTLRDLGLSADALHDVARLTAVVFGYKNCKV